MRKITYVIGACIALVAVFAAFWAISYAKPVPQSDLPQEQGDYDVPGHPELRLRVFVYHEKQLNNGSKAQPQVPVETCLPAASADPDSTAVVHGAGWKMPATWSYRLNPGSVPSSVGSGNLATMTANAFAKWSTAMNNAVAITPGADTTVTRAQFDGANIIAWGRTSGTALAVSYIWYNKATGALSEVDTIMNSKFSWKWSNPATWQTGQVCAYQGVYDAQDILTHELGHTVGLNDEYTTADYGNATMYGYGAKGETKKDTLTTGDIGGVWLIY